jgi:hypothetical protein
MSKAKMKDGSPLFADNKNEEDKKLKVMQILQVLAINSMHST